MHLKSSFVKALCFAYILSGLLYSGYTFFPLKITCCQLYLNKAGKNWCNIFVVFYYSKICIQYALGNETSKGKVIWELKIEATLNHGGNGEKDH